MIFKKYLVGSAILGSILIGGSTLINLAAIPFIVKKIGLVDYGYWSLLTMFSGFAAALDFGTARAVSFYVGRSKRKNQESRIFWCGIILTASATAFLIIIALLVLIFKAGAILNSNSVSQEILSYVGFFGVLMTGVALVTNFFRAFLEVKLKVYLIHILGFTFNIINLGIVYILIKLNKNIEWLLAASFLSTLLIMLGYIFCSYCVGLPAWKRPNLRVVKILIGRGTGYFALNLANVLSLPLNRLFVVLLGGSAGHALFDIGLRVALAANSLLQLMSTPLFGILLKIKSVNALEALKLAKKMTILIFILYLSGMIVLSVSAEWLAGMITNQSAGDLRWVLLVVVGGVAFTGVAEPAMRTLWTWGYEMKAVYIRTVALIANAIIVLALKDFPPVLSISIAYSVPLFFSSIITISFIGKIKKHELAKFV